MIKDTLWLDIPDTHTSIRVDRIVAVYLENKEYNVKDDKFKCYIMTEDMFDGDCGYGCSFKSIDEALKFRDDVLKQVTKCLKEINNPPIRLV